MKIAIAIIVIIIIIIFVSIIGYYMYSSSGGPFMIENPELGLCWQIDGDGSAKDPIALRTCDAENDKQYFTYGENGSIRPKIDKSLSVHRKGAVDSDVAAGDGIHLYGEDNANSKWKFGENIELDGKGHYIHAGENPDEDPLNLGSDADHANARWNKKGRSIFG